MYVSIPSSRRYAPCFKFSVDRDLIVCDVRKKVQIASGKPLKPFGHKINRACICPHLRRIVAMNTHFPAVFTITAVKSPLAFDLTWGHCLAYRWSVCAFLLSSIVIRRQLGLSRGGLHSYSNTMQACFQPVRRGQQHIQISKARVGANGAYRVLFLSTGAIITGVKAHIPRTAVSENCY